MLAYKTTPQSTTGMTQTEFFLGKCPHTRLDLLKPNLADRVESKQQQQTTEHNKTFHLCSFQKGKTVCVHTTTYNCGKKIL